MKKIILSIVISISILYSILAYAQRVFVEEQFSNRGELYIRLINDGNYTINCAIESGREYFSITIYPRQASRWYRMSGPYSWQCR